MEPTTTPTAMNEPSNGAHHAAPSPALAPAPAPAFAENERTARAPVAPAPTPVEFIPCTTEDAQAMNSTIISVGRAEEALGQHRADYLQREGMLMQEVEIARRRRNQNADAVTQKYLGGNGRDWIYEPSQNGFRRRR